MVIFAALVKDVRQSLHPSLYSHRGINSTVKIMKVFGFIRKHRAKAAIMVGWQIAGRVRPAPNDNRGLHLKGDGGVVLAVSPE